MKTFHGMPNFSKILAKSLLPFGLALCFQVLLARTAAGDEWVQINHDGFASGSLNHSVLVLGVFDGHLFAPTYHETHAEVWKIPLGSTDPYSWTNVTPPWGAGSTTVLGMANHAGYLYVGTDRCEIWRLDRGGAWIDATPSDPGWTRGSCAAISMAFFQDALYAARGGPLTIWRLPPGGTWEMVVDDAFGDAGNNFQAHLTVYSSRLYAATGVRRPGAPLDGTEVWWTANGTDWEQVNEDGFGDRKNAVAPAAAVFGGQLYIGTINHDGGQIWRYDGSEWENVSACEPADVALCSPKAQALATSGARIYAGFGGAVPGGSFIPGINVLDRTRFDSGWAYSTTAEGFGDFGNMSVESLVGAFPFVVAATLNNTTGTEIWMRQPTAIERLLARLGRNLRLLLHERRRVRSCYSNTDVAACYLNRTRLNDIRPFFIETYGMIGQTSGDFPGHQELFSGAGADMEQCLALIDQAGSLLKKLTPNLSPRRQLKLVTKIGLLLKRSQILNRGVRGNLRPLEILD